MKHVLIAFLAFFATSAFAVLDDNSTNQNQLQGQAQGRRRPRGSASITGSTTPAAPLRMLLSPATMPTRTATPLTVAWALVALPVVARPALRQATPSRLSTRNRWLVSRLAPCIPLRPVWAPATSAAVTRSSTLRSGLRGNRRNARFVRLPVVSRLSG